MSLIHVRNDIITGMKHTSNTGKDTHAYVGVLRNQVECIQKQASNLGGAWTLYNDHHHPLDLPWKLT